MDQTTFVFMLSAWAGLAAAAISPGPNMFICIEKGISQGRRAAIQTAFGIGIAAILWVFFVVLGFGAATKYFPNIIPSMGILGGAYLIYLGIKSFIAILKRTKSSFTFTARNTMQFSAWGNASHGFLISISNPKVALFWLSLTSIVGFKLQALPILILFALGCCLVTFTIYSTYGILFSTPKIRDAYTQYAKTGNFIFGLVFCSLGLGFLIYAIQLL
jgi:threonine/homoserine/homoserine lactone efflux protein